jgi:hypothetical protein
MDALSPAHPARRVVFMKGAQVGGTECGNNWIGHVIHHTPGPTLAVQPKRHLLTDTIGMLLAVMVHPASVQDREGAEVQHQVVVLAFGEPGSAADHLDVEATLLVGRSRAMRSLPGASSPVVSTLALATQRSRPALKAARMPSRSGTAPAL